MTDRGESDGMSPEWVKQVEDQLRRHAERLDGHDAELAAFRTMVLAKMSALETLYAEQLQLTSTVSAQVGRLSNEATKDRLMLDSIDAKLGSLVPDIRRLLSRLGVES